MITPKIEVGFDLQNGNFFTLNDPVKGVLNNSTYVLAGFQMTDVTESVRSFSIRRGKSRDLDRYETGVATIVFDNRNRWFDPVYEDSPYNGNILPRRAIQITVNNVMQYTGVIDDWNLEYSIDNDSTSTATATDGFSVLAKQTLAGGTATEQTTGARIEAVLSSVDVDWPVNRRVIATGDATVGADVIAPDTNALSYLQTIETSEQGKLFIDRDGNVRFTNRNGMYTSIDAPTLADDGTGLEYQQIGVVYGTELLFNEVVVSSNVTMATAVAQDLVSIDNYGVANLTLSDLPLATTDQVVNTATFLASKYANPEYRFESVSIILDDLSVSDQNKLLNLELGDVAKVVYTPNDIPPAISKWAEVISISISSQPNRSVLQLGFATLDYAVFVLDDEVFGRLDSGNVLTW
mgnify:CR=1 FL=1|jgi:hypothetical protein